MGALDLQHEGIVDEIDTGLTTRLIDTGDGRAAPAMLTHDVKHRALIQHRVRNIGLAVTVTG